MRAVDRRTRNAAWRPRGRARSACAASAVVLAAICLASCSDPAAEREARRLELWTQRQQLVRQFMQVQEPIRRVQAAALDGDSVRALQEAFYRLLRERMIQLEPESESQLDRARELGIELDRVSGPVVLAPGESPPTSEEKLALIREFDRLEKALRPLEAQAMEDSAVSAAFRALQDELTAEMIRRDTSVTLVLDRLQVIKSHIAEIDRQIEQTERGKDLTPRG